MYHRLRNFIKPWKSKGYMSWVKQKYPNRDIHHLIGSQTAIKLSDMLIYPVDRKTHEYAEAHKEEFFLHTLPESLNLLGKYIHYLEDKMCKYEETISYLQKGEDER